MLDLTLQPLYPNHINIAIYDRGSFLEKQQTNSVVLELNKTLKEKPLEFINSVSNLRTLPYDNLTLSKAGQCKYQCMRDCALMPKSCLTCIIAVIGIFTAIGGATIIFSSTDTAVTKVGIAVCMLGIFELLVGISCCLSLNAAGSSWDPLSRQVAEGAHSALEIHQSSHEYTNNVRKLASQMKAVIETLKSHQKFNDHLSRLVMDNTWDLGIKYIWFGRSTE